MPSCNLDDVAGARAAIEEAQTLKKALHADATLRDDVNIMPSWLHCAEGEVAAPYRLLSAAPPASSMEMRIERSWRWRARWRAHPGHADEAAICTHTAREIGRACWLLFLPHAAGSLDEISVLTRILGNNMPSAQTAVPPFRA